MGKAKWLVAVAGCTLAGGAWADVIDISAGLMVLVSLTGLILIFFLQKRLKTGLIAVAIGTAVCIAIYEIWVS